jgi:hypothetical protein
MQTEEDWRDASFQSGGASEMHSLKGKACPNLFQECKGFQCKIKLSEKFQKKRKKMRYLYRKEFYSATKKNEILSLASKWMELENIILSKVS